MDGAIPPTSVIVMAVALPAWFSSTVANIKQIFHIKHMDLLRKTRPCVRLWFAEISRSMEGCWLATESSKGCRQTRPSTSPDGAAVLKRLLTIRLDTVLGIPEMNQAAARLLRWNKGCGAATPWQKATQSLGKAWIPSRSADSDFLVFFYTSSRFTATR